MKKLFIIVTFLSTTIYSYGQLPWIGPLILKEIAKLPKSNLPEIEISSVTLPPINIDYGPFDLPRVYSKHSQRKCETNVTIRRFLNHYYQPVADSNIIYDYFELKKNAITISAGFYQIEVKAKIDFFLDGSVPLNKKTTIKQWLYVGKHTNIYSPIYGKMNIIPNTLYFKISPHSSRFLVSTNPDKINTEMINVVILPSKNNNTSIQLLKKYFSQKYGVSCYSKENCYPYSDFGILINPKDSVKVNNMFKEIEKSDTLLINEYILEYYGCTAYDDFNGPGTDISRQIINRHAHIYYFPNQDMTKLKQLLNQTGFRNISKTYDYYNRPCLSAKYIGTFHIESMNDNLKNLFEYPYVSNIDMSWLK